MSNYYPLNRKGLWLASVSLSLFALFFSTLILGNTADRNIEERISLETFPETFGSWTAKAELGIDIRSLDVLRLSSYVKRVYTNPEGQQVFLYIGYWASQTGEHQAAKHSPILCLPSNGWLTSNRENHLLSFGYENSNVEIPVRRILGEKRGSSTLFYYWFFTGAEYYNQEWYALIKLSLQNLLYGRNDGGIIEIATNLETGLSKEEAEAKANLLIQSFLNDLTPYLHSKLQQA
jgi:EpsI family protein